MVPAKEYHIFWLLWNAVLLIIFSGLGLFEVTAQQEAEGANVTEADYYSSSFQGGYAPHGHRPGLATRTHSCMFIRAVPNNLRDGAVMKPHGISLFYQKYTEAYGIPVLSSQFVPDNALRRACYTLRVLLAGNSAVRQSFFRLSGRVAVIGQNEDTTTIPEHSHLPRWWNVRARGLGATSHAPVSTGGEENVLCYNTDMYRDQDIFLHESAHGVHLLGAANGVPGWDARLRRLYHEAKARGLWANTYSMSSAEEYFAEGVQSFFNVNSFSPRPNGVSGPIDTQAKLRTYDPPLFNLIKEIFPCDNVYLKRCLTNRGQENAQRLQMDCEVAGAGAGGGGGGGDCTDSHPHCGYWAGQNECMKRPDYMNLNCPLSCNQCATVTCVDNHQHCAHWASTGQCQTSQGFMNANCRESCELC